MSGSRIFAYSYVKLKNGKKIFLTTNYYSLRDLMNNSRKNITVTKSKLISNPEITLRKDDIAQYGETGI